LGIAVASCAVLLLARHRLDSLPKSSPKSLRLELTKRSAIQSRSPRFRRPKRSWPAAMRSGSADTLELALRKPRRAQREPPFAFGHPMLISSPQFQPFRKRQEHKEDRQFESPPLYQRGTANRQRSHLTRQCLRLQQICSNATRN